MLEEQQGGLCVWSRVSEGEGREGTGQVVQVSVGHREDLGFYPQGGGSPGGLWAEEGRGLIQVLTGAPWWLLQGRQTGGRVGAGDQRGGD